MKALVTGAAGFIGSNLVDRLLADGHEVTGVDNFSTGQPEFLKAASECPRFRLMRGDLLQPGALSAAMEGIDMVFHLAANADVRSGTDDPRKDLEQNTIATSNLMEAMRASDVRRIAFTSTASVYGEPSVFPTPEDAPFPVQTSFYAASKLAAEAMIAAYCEGFGFQAYIFRLVSILGERYTHGHIVDFYRQLLSHPDHLDVRGNGRQRKSYLCVNDSVTAMLTAIEKANGKINLFNLGTDEYCEVNQSIGWISAHLNASPRLTYSGGERGWVGDSPFILLDCGRIRRLGWTPLLPIREAVVRTLEFLDRNRWVLER